MDLMGSPLSTTPTGGPLSKQAANEELRAPRQSAFGERADNWRPVDDRSVQENPADLIGCEHLALNNETQQGLIHQDPILSQGAVNLAKLIRSLEHPNQPRAYVVGGMVRDDILGKMAIDMDMAIVGMSIQEIRTVLESSCPGRVHVRGTNPPVVYLSFSSTHGCEIAAINPGEAHWLGQRNFTCNAMAWDPLDGSVLDPFGGARDLKNGHLRTVHERLFAEEPINIVKAVQLACRHNLQIEHTTMDSIRKVSAKLDWSGLNPEVVQSQVRKILLSCEKPSRAFELLRTAGIIEQFLGDLNALQNTPQDPKHHREGQGWKHTMLALDSAARIIRRPNFGGDPLIVMLGTLCHDLGKVTRTRIEDGRISARGHEAAGVEPTRRVLETLGFGSNVIKKVQKVVLYHMRPGELANGKNEDGIEQRRTSNSLRLLAKGLRPAGFEDLLNVCEADARGRGPDSETRPGYRPAELLRRWASIIDLDRLVASRLLKESEAHCLMVPDGQPVGVALREVETLRNSGMLASTIEAKEHILLRYGLLPTERAHYGLNLGVESAARYHLIRSNIRAGNVASRTDLLALLDKEWGHSKS